MCPLPPHPNPPRVRQTPWAFLFSLLPLELQIVLETGLAAYFELAHCPVELEARKEREEDTLC